MIERSGRRGGGSEKGQGGKSLVMGGGARQSQGEISKSVAKHG